MSPNASHAYTMAFRGKSPEHMEIVTGPLRLAATHAVPDPWGESGTAWHRSCGYAAAVNTGR